MNGNSQSERDVEESKVLLNRKRLVSIISKQIKVISNAIKFMEENAKKYLESFQESPDYRPFRTAFRQFQHTPNLKEVVDFQLCDNADADQSFYRQNQKKIVICYNKINDYESFAQLMTYNLVFLYDDLRANINWYDCSMISCMKIRALNLSRKCPRNDKICYETEVKSQLERNEVCKGKFNEYFENSYKQCILDIAPVNSIQQTKKNIFF